MLNIRELKMTFGGRVLFEDASFAVNYGDRVALVGPNGAGKTTLFSIILKQLEPDAGEVARDEWTMVGHLPQEAEANGDETILDVATGRVDELPRLEKRLHELEKAGDVSSSEYMEAHAKHDALNDPQVETKAKKMLRGLGFRDTDFNRKANEMSGGWIMRARLARLLVMEPDLLLLDEPTNHLDLLALLWLQNYLKAESRLKSVAHVKPRCTLAFDCLAQCGLRDGLAGWGQFCIDKQLVAALRGDVKKGLFFRGVGTLPFGQEIRSVRELLVRLMTRPALA